MNRISPHRTQSSFLSTVTESWSGGTCYATQIFQTDSWWNSSSQIYFGKVYINSIFPQNPDISHICTSEILPIHYSFIALKHWLHILEMHLISLNFSMIFQECFSNDEYHYCICLKHDILEIYHVGMHNFAYLSF